MKSLPKAMLISGVVASTIFMSNAYAADKEKIYLNYINSECASTVEATVKALNDQKNAGTAGVVKKNSEKICQCNLDKIVAANGSPEKPAEDFGDCVGKFSTE